MKECLKNMDDSAATSWIGSLKETQQAQQVIDQSIHVAVANMELEEAREKGEISNKEWKEIEKSRRLIEEQSKQEDRKKSRNRSRSRR